MTTITDIEVTLEDLANKGREIVAANKQVETGDQLAKQAFHKVRRGYEDLAELVVQAEKQGKTTAEIAETLNDAGLSEERKWQPSDIATWSVARDVMAKPNVPDGVQIALLPRQWQGSRTYRGQVPVYDKAGKPVLVDGKVKEVPGVSLIPLIRAARDHAGIGSVRSAVKAATDGKAAVAAIEAIFETPKPAPSQQKLVRAAKNKLGGAQTPGIDVGDKDKIKEDLKQIKSYVAAIEKTL